MISRHSLRVGGPAGAVVAERRGPIPAPLLIAAAVCGVTLALFLVFASSEGSSSSALIASVSEWLNEDSDNRLDQRLQLAATNALGERSGTVIIMDPQTGRIRAVVNSKLAFEESFRPGSTIKAFTALAALRSGLLEEESHAVCREKYSHDAFHTTCSHPRDLPPLNPTEAIAYSCNYYFGKVGERLTEPAFGAILNDFGFGKQSGVNRSAESAGRLMRGEWRPQNVMGEGDYLQTTPIQLINAYSTLVNGGHRFTPRIAHAKGFTPTLQTSLAIKDEHRNLVLKGMRGAVRYGTAESARLHSLPIYTFGKTGTAIELNGFRMQGWFVGFASAMDDDAMNGQGNDSEIVPAAPDKARLAILVFLSRGHGADAAAVARPIFDAYAQTMEELGVGETRRRAEEGADGTLSGTSTSLGVPASPSLGPRASLVRVHLVSENITRAMPLEDYVRGVVAAEGSTESEIEALKALAIASRTYALKNMHRHARDGYDFCTTTHCQRYRSLDADSGVQVSSAVVQAVQSTKGEVLVGSDAQIADSYFSASCGGATADLASLWGGNSPPYLRGVRDDSCLNEPHANWTDTISHAQLLKALKSDPRTNVGDRLYEVRILRTDNSGRAELVALEGVRRLTVKGWDFKIIVGRTLGWNLLKSSRFTVERSGTNFVFRGSGFGHGLGLCQEGAHVMAARGSSYRHILARYFPGTDVAGNVTQTVSLRSRKEASPALADLLWNNATSNLVASPLRNPSTLCGEGKPTSFEINRTAARTPVVRATTRRTISSEQFRINYPNTIDQREVERMLTFLQSSRKSLIARISLAGVSAQFPVLEVFINETTGDFVGRTQQPPWAAAATQNNRIELQPLLTLKRRGILETTLRHELVHTIVDNLGGGRTPRWLAEGLALHYAGEGRLIAGYQSRSRLTTEAIDKQISEARSASEMKVAYASAYSEVKRLITVEGERSVWRRVAR